MRFPCVLVCALLGLTSACGSPEPAASPGEPERGPLPAIAAPTLEEAIVRARQELSGPAYALSAEGTRLRGENAQLDAAVEIDGHGARVVPHGDGPALVLATSALGCAGDERPLAPADRVEHPRANRAELVRRGVREWIVNGQAGVEQGFDVLDVPTGCAALRIVNAPSEGLVADIDHEGEGVVLRDARQHPLLRVGHAIARDARGISLPVRFEPAGTSWALRVEIAGAELPIAIDPLVFRYEGTLDERVRNSYFGLQVALYEDTAVVGAYYDDGFVGIQGAGSAYVFRRTGTSWALEAELAASGAQENDWFGWEVSIWGDTVAVGAMKEQNESGADGGAVYVWTRAGSTWTQEARLPGASHFGCGVSVHEDTLAVGHYGGPDLAGPSMITVFRRFGTTWANEQYIYGVGSAFGRKVAVHGDTLLVASMMESGSRAQEGRVHVYRRNAGGWAPVTTLQASDPASYDWFGYEIGFDGSTIVVGAPGSWQLTTPHAARTFLFEPSGASFAQVARLEMPASALTSQFDVAVAGTYAVAGPELFERGAGGGWTRRGSLGGLSTAEGVALWGDTLAVGRNQAVDVYRLGDPLAPGVACRLDVECDSGHCVEGVCCDQACNDDIWITQRCSSCLAARTGLQEGVCAPLRAGVAETVVCRGGLDSCDVQETCSPALDVCPGDAVAPAGTMCRDAYGVCDRAEYCDGTSKACPTDLTASGTVCRPAAGPCDIEERCSFGILCPADVHQAPSFVCRPAAGDCDLVETCGASSDGSCPIDRFLTDTVCRDAVGECDVSEWCTGTSATCPADTRRGSETVCRASRDVCDLEERCDGMRAVCPDDWTAPEASSCSDGLACTGPELCRGGRCSPTAPIGCDDGDSCTADACTEPSGACEHTPIDGCCTGDPACDDGDACTTDRCVGARCAHEPIASCGPADGGALDAGRFDDGGVANDAGADDEDAGTGPPGASDGGCSCAAPGRSRGGPDAMLAGVLLASAIARRRRRPRPGRLAAMRQR